MPSRCLRRGNRIRFRRAGPGGRPVDGLPGRRYYRPLIAPAASCTVSLSLWRDVMRPDARPARQMPSAQLQQPWRRVTTPRGNSRGE